MREIRPLTALRAFAAFWVFMCHMPPERHVSQNIIELLQFNGAVGVTLFFVLSGFLITLRYYERTRAGHLVMSEYVVKRAARILPLYLVVLGFAFLVTGVPQSAIVNITLTQAYFSSLKYSGLAVAWSLCVEEAFYLLAPLVFRCIARYGLLRALLGITLALAVIGLGLVFISGVTLAGAATDFMTTTPHMLSYTIFGRFSDFAVGIAAAMLYMRFKPRFSSTWALAFLPLVLALLWFIDRGGSPETGALWADRLLALPFAAIILALAMPDGRLARLMSMRLLVYLGYISYAVYLIHIVQPLRDFSAVGWLPYYVMISLVSALLYHVIEKPARRVIVWGYDAFMKSIRLPAAAPS